MKRKQDTIYAISTPPGKSAIAVVRVSGTESFRCIEKISHSMPKKPNMATFNKIITSHGAAVDHSITTFFKSPKSYTGEDMVEISLHGGNAVIKKFINILKKNKNIRIAEPGEFTRRAFENNKLDITQIEAIADLVNAETEAQRKQAYNQLEGNISNKIKEIHNSLKYLLADAEAIIDFSDEDLPTNLLIKIKEQIENIKIEIRKVLFENNKSNKIRDGYIVGIIGNTNTGKSSFINNISNSDIAIVTDQPGTTRDIIESYLDINGLPIKFYDSAGIRKSQDKIEKIGINKSIKLSKNSDINLLFVDNISEIKQFSNVKNKILVQSKYDIRKKPIKNKEITNISSKTNYGIDKLLQLIHKRLRKNKIFYNNYISRERHISFLVSAKKYLDNANINNSFDILAEDIRLSFNSISKIYGKTDIEDILDIIFNDFCIGK